MTSNRESIGSARSDGSADGLVANPAGIQNVDSGSDDDESFMIGGQRRRGVPAISGSDAVSIFYYAGLVQKQEISVLKRLLFRATKGKVLCKVCEDAPIDYSLGLSGEDAESE